MIKYRSEAIINKNSPCFSIYKKKRRKKICNKKKLKEEKVKHCETAELSLIIKYNRCSCDHTKLAFSVGNGQNSL